MKKSNYDLFLSDILNEIQMARINAVNETVKVMTKLYFTIGEIIVSKQKKFGWGSSIISKLADDIKSIENTTVGFSLTNLKYMRQFYLAYKDKENLLQATLNIP